MFEWYKYLAFAEYISSIASNMPDQEACFRAATSRAYYAAFCSVREFLKIKNPGINYDGGDAHKKVAEDIKSVKNKACEKIAAQLISIKKSRRDADYINKLSQSPRAMAYQTIRISKNIIDQISI